MGGERRAKKKGEAASQGREGKGSACSKRGLAMCGGGGGGVSYRGRRLLPVPEGSLLPVPEGSLLPVLEGSLLQQSIPGSISNSSRE